MPYCKVSKYQQDKFNEGIEIYYEQYGQGDIKVLLVIGLAGTHDSWSPQIKGLTGVDILNKDASHAKDIDGNKREYSNGSLTQYPPEMQDLLVHNSGTVFPKNSIQVCSFDNRGVGQSTVPKHRSYYSTTIMARDALALLDHLGWKKAHVFGHSMGAMIACKLAAIEPTRISSLALLNATGGGFECFPKIDRTMISIILRFLKARTPEERADVDLDTHYTKEFLEAYIGNVKRREILYQEYVRNISKSGMQIKHGFDGHANACWTHKMTPSEYEIIQTAGIHIAVIHGRDDIIAHVRHGRKIAKNLHPVARMIELHGGHLVSHEKSEAVNQALIKLIEASELNMSPQEWVNLPQHENGLEVKGVSTQYQGDKEDEIPFSTSFYSFWRHLQMMLLYFLGLFMILWNLVKQFSICFKKEKVEPFHAAVDAHDQCSSRREQSSVLVSQF
ncbi:hypothetical protein SUGI_0273930 [Cryptomeria japonica]|uniref:uncharacterized protein LOC131060196 n=1 Tax=Cryptomeria japonica TaxID=3369 RepID=UPI002408DDE7|nr:uncharacterized protein LOC131060196 [Cryptomeria japonica]GLJ16274.1 hypothetical protein SUGI_0273930 [Cryptomeria japonica]